MQGTSENGIAEYNAGLFDNPEVAEWYDNQQLYPAERIILDQFRHAYAGKRLLDLGVGTGRTTKPLLPLVGEYIGIDRSQPMLALARRNFPTATFLDLDVRAIGQFGAERFRTVRLSPIDGAHARFFHLLVFGKPNACILGVGENGIGHGIVVNGVL